jgi:hypothetical protein
MAISKIPSAGFQDNVKFRNLIINGDMSIAQRGTSQASITAAGYYTIDRWRTDVVTAGTWTQSQSTEVPTGQSFFNSTKFDCTTADGSLAAGDRIFYTQRIEDQNCTYLKKGTSSAESTTLSFWVKSNKTGTYICELFDSQNSRHINKSYTISSADTWEKKTITFAGDTTGAFANDNGIGLMLQFWLAAGSTYTSGTLQTSWGSSVNANRAVGQVNLADSTSNEWYITGVQLEAGTSASDFEFLPRQITESLCFRYFCKFDFPQTSPFFTSHKQTTNTVRTAIETPVPMRTTPTINGTGQPNIAYQAGNGTSVTVSSGTSLTVIGGSIDLNRFIASNPSATGIGDMVNAFAYLGDLECSAEL